MKQKLHLPKHCPTFRDKEPQLVIRNTLYFYPQTWQNAISGQKQEQEQQWYEGVSLLSGNEQTEHSDDKI